MFHDFCMSFGSLRYHWFPLSPPSSFRRYKTILGLAWFTILSLEPKSKFYPGGYNKSLVWFFAYTFTYMLSFRKWKFRLCRWIYAHSHAHVDNIEYENQICRISLKTILNYNGLSALLSVMTSSRTHFQWITKIKQTTLTKLYTFAVTI